jgi:branched-chain amino acid transport system permease protein
MKKLQRAYLLNFAAVLASFVVLYALQLSGVVGRYYQGIFLTLLINIILTVSLNLATGFLGQLTLGHAGFVSVGAYTAALISLRSGLPEGIGFPIALLSGGLVAAIFGIMIGIPALRLRGDYLAIITLGFGEIIRVFILNVKFTGGASGLNGIPILTNFPYAYGIMVLTITVMFLLIRSRHGRAIISIREDEIAAESSGINTTYYKLLAFTVAAFFAGVAGGLQAHLLFVLDASKFGFAYSVDIMVMVVLGGLGSITGSILAASILTILPEVLRDLAEYRMLIYAILLIVLMLYRPSGLLGRKELSHKILGQWAGRLSGKRPVSKRPSKQPTEGD